MHGLWQTNIPSRFLDELPEGNVEVTEPQGGFGGFAGYGGYGASRFDAATSFGSNYSTPGWQRAQRGAGASGFAEDDSRYEMDEDEELHHSPIARRAAGAGDSDAGGSKDSRGPKGSPRRVPLTIEGELVAKSTGTVSPFSLGDRVFHQKFGNGNITAIDGNKLTIQFDRAGEKRVVDSFVQRV
jgi:DNA helicase-2/ATP-dependent DNA helicase PcrA